ncbi:transcriptional regulator, IclR family [Caldicellulosiruptor hydrothermalis 108]|uniref:Glycerol operon regulatory protein n=1 Tax=Caldicellulosiruptor hydrothermalis (strain DSM 18901 / VKM B-2411 / 108) TaxID=632292 RepID=E4QCE6_CALH1|nr:IclR family transcriptional regulator [Caldicellulosiruptor hydrothermalis]ADQ06242.1 transcriptional regulator, IclR family [Caldicellulosiruptor hydrothermalis 108]
MSNIQVLERAINILELLGEKPKGIGISEISRELNLPKSTVHRILDTLLQKGYVEKNMENDKYKLGLRIVELSNKILSNMELRNEAHPYLEELMNYSNEVVHLCVLRDGEMVYIDKVECPNPIRLYSQIGRRVPVHCTAVGKATLAFLPREEVISILQRKGMSRRTKNTITDMQKLLNQLEEIRELGYAVDDVENEEGVRGIGAPVFNYTGRVVAAISIAGPVSRITKERIPDLAEKLKETAQKISERLGYFK